MQSDAEKDHLHRYRLLHAFVGNEKNAARGKPMELYKQI